MNHPDAFATGDDAGHEHSALIFGLSVEAANAVRIHFRQNGEELDQAAWFCVLMEYLSLYVLLTDRALSGGIGLSQRPLSADRFAARCIENAAATIFQSYSPEKIRRIQTEFMDHYRQSQHSYGACEKLSPEQGEGHDGTLIWEFAKTVGAITGHEVDAAYLVFFTQIVNLPGLKLPELAARPSGRA
jgi:hypothetical protein